MALRLLLPLLLVAATLLIAQAQGIGSSAWDCCVNHSQNDISRARARLTSYRLQGPESGCMLRAVVFSTKKNKKICASPTDRTVKELMQYLDEKVKNDKNKKKGRSQGSGGRPKQRRRQQV